MATEGWLVQFVKTWGPLIRNGMLTVMGIAVWILAVYVMYEGRLQVGGLLLGAGFVMLAFARLSLFKSIKGFGVDAQLHELNEKIDEAENLFKHIKEIVGLTANVTFQLLAGLDSPKQTFTRKVQLEIADSFRRQMEALGESTETIKQYMAPWHASNLRWLLHPVKANLDQYVMLQNQNAVKDSYTYPHDAPADDERRLAIEARNAETRRLVTSIHSFWQGDEFEYVAGIESAIIDSSCGSDEERKQLLFDVRQKLSQAKHYTSNLDFVDRQAWIDAQPGGLVGHLGMRLS